MASRKPITPTSGVVVAVSGITGPAASIRYTIHVNAIGGGVIPIQNVRPSHNSQWIVDGFDVIPFPVGYPVTRAYWVGDMFRWDDEEPPAWEQCEPADDPAPAPVREDDPSTIEDESIIPPEDGGLSGNGLTTGPIVPGGDKEGAAR